MATVGQTRIELAELVERVLARAGIEPFAQTPDWIDIALTNLHFKLAELAGKGLYPWQVASQVIQLVGGKANYTLPDGTVDVLHVNQRSWAQIAGAEAGSTTQRTLTYTAPTRTVMASVTLTAAVNLLANTLTFETFENAVFTVRHVEDRVWPTGVHWFEFDGALLPSITRATLTGAGNATVAALRAASTYHDLPLGVLNRDDYSQQPDRVVTALNPNSYWFDKQTAPLVRLWRPPSDSSLLLWVQFQHQGVDAPSLFETISIPSVYFSALIDQVAYEVTKEREPVDLSSKAQTAMKAEAEGTLVVDDGAPLRLAPNLRRYTR